jgi:hypothetical protein
MDGIRHGKTGGYGGFERRAKGITSKASAWWIQTMIVYVMPVQSEMANSSVVRKQSKIRLSLTKIAATTVAGAFTLRSMETIVF